MEAAGSRHTPLKKTLTSGSAVFPAPSPTVHTTVRVSGCPKHLANSPSGIRDLLGPASLKPDWTLSSHTPRRPASAGQLPEAAGKPSELTRDYSKAGNVWWQAS